MSICVLLSYRNRERIHESQFRALTPCATGFLRDRNDTSSGIRVRDGLINNTGLNNYILAIEVNLEAVQASRSGTIEKLTIDVIVRPMTGTFEAKAIVTERDG